MAKYRKTALVEAEQFLPPHQIPDGCYQKGNIGDVASGHGEWCLKTLEGEHKLRAADYVCTGPAGERWNVEKKIFEATYEPAALTASPPVVEREAIARIIVENCGGAMMLLPKQAERAAGAILALTPVEGVGELLAAIDEWADDPTPNTAQGVLDARANLKNGEIK